MKKCITTLFTMNLQKFHYILKSKDVPYDYIFSLSYLDVPVYKY